MLNVTLSPAAVSALECAGLDWDAAEVGPIERAWSTRRKLTFDISDRDALFDALNEASNSEDASAQNTTDKEMRRHANTAARALATVAGKVLRVGR